MAKGTDPQQGSAPRSSTAFWGGGLGGLIVVGYLAFRVLNPILAAALVIVAATVLGIAALARDWHQHPSYEEREQLRAERRKIKFAQNQGARDRDRAKWEAHQARQRQKDAPQAAGGTTPTE